MNDRRRTGSDQSPANFVSRWSRRKQAARASRSPDPEMANGPVQAPVGPASAPDHEPEVPSRTDAEPAPIPELDTLTEQSDYRRFMQSDVSADLRRLALRKLFKAPVFGLRDGLDDYDEDFTTFEALGNVVTSDMQFHQQRLEKLAAQESTEPGPASSEAPTRQTAEAAPGPGTGQDASQEKAETGHGASPAEPVNQAAWETVPLKPADPLEPPPPVLAADRSGLAVRAVNAAARSDPKDS